MVKLSSILVVSLLTFFVGCASQANLPTVKIQSQVAVASATREATDAGLEILEAGGNAFDAAIAVSAALGVTEPYSSGFGGGGLWLLYRASDEKYVMVDGREKAPLKAHRDMYLDAEGNVREEAVRWGALSAGIPGMPAALIHLAENYGSLSLATSLQPSIKLAEEGFPASPVFAAHSDEFKSYMQRSPAASAVYLKDGQAFPAGEIVVQPDLANTIKAIANYGREGFYAGEVAEKLITGTNSAGGIWTQQDFDEYQIVEREPITFTYRDLKITSASPPSSGGVAMAQIFNLLEPFDLVNASEQRRVHLIVEAMRRAYRDRAQYLGDTDFVEVPMARLTSKAYAAELRKSIDLVRATPSNTLPAAYVEKDGGYHTTHFSVADADGNRVSATLTINYPFGACFMPEGTGVMLNNEMDDFSAKPGASNLYGLVGGEANAIAPGKRMLSSMSPSMVESQDRIAMLGTPGGSKIITMVMLAALAFEEGADAKTMVDLPRFHHQYLPDLIEFEPTAINDKLKQALVEAGHKVEVQESAWGNMHVVIQNKINGRLDAASDQREVGRAEVRALGVTR